jgi:TonB family protein
MAAAYPLTAPSGSTGVARIGCKVADDGRLADCHIVSEEPGDAGFGAAALSLMARFRATPEAVARMNGAVVVPIRFGVAAPEPPRRDLRFQRDGYETLGDAGPYYPDRAARMGLTSVVEADCHVTESGRLKDCQIVSVSTAGFGFEDAFLKMVERRWVTAAPAPEGTPPPSNGAWRVRMIFDGRRH